MVEKPLDSAMDNVLAWRMGQACTAAAEDQKCGDPIDRGLILLHQLNEKGFGVFEKQKREE